MRRHTRINLNSNYQPPSRPPDPASVSNDTAPPEDADVRLEANFNRMEERLQHAHIIAEGTTSRGGRNVGGAVAHPRSSDATDLTPSFVQGSSGQTPRTTQQPHLPPLDIPDPSIPRRPSGQQPTVNGQISRSGSSSSTPVMDTRQPVHNMQPHSQPQQLHNPVYLHSTHPRAQPSPVLHNQSHPFTSPVPQYPSPSQQYAPMPHMSPRTQAQMLPPSQHSPAHPNLLALISERLDFIVDSLEANRGQQKTMSQRLLAYERNFGAIHMKLEKQQEDMNNVISFLKNIHVDQEAPIDQRLTALEKTLATTVETVNNSLQDSVNSAKSSRQYEDEKVPGRKADQEDKTFQFLTVLAQRVGDIGHSLSEIRHALGIDHGNYAARQKGKQRAFEKKPTAALPEWLLSASDPSASTVIDVDALNTDDQSRSPTAVDRPGLRGWMPGGSSLKRPPAGTDSEGRSIMERLEANQSLLMDLAELLENMRDPQANLTSNMDLAADHETPAPSANEENVNKDARQSAQPITLKQLASRLSSSIPAQILSRDRSGTPISTASGSREHTSKIGGLGAQITADNESSLENRTQHSTLLRQKQSPHPSISSSAADSEPYIIGKTTLEDMMSDSQRISPPITSKNSGPSRMPAVAGAKVPQEPTDKTNAFTRTQGTIQVDISSSRSVAKTRSMSLLDLSDSTKSPNKVSTPVKSYSVNFDHSPAAWSHSSALPFDLAELPENGTPTSSKRSLRSTSQKGNVTPSSLSSNDNMRVTRSKSGSPNATVLNPAAVKTAAERAITSLLTAQKRMPHKAFTLASVVPRIREADPAAPATAQVTTTQDASTDTQETQDISIDQNATSGTLSSIDTTVTVQDTTDDQSDLPSLPSRLATPDDASESYVLDESYQLPSQPEGSVASLRQETLANPFIHAGVGVRSTSVEPGGGSVDDNMNCDVSIEVEPVDEDCIEDKSGEVMITTQAVVREPSHMSALTPLPESEAPVSLNDSRAASIVHLGPEACSSVSLDQSMDQEPMVSVGGHDQPVAPEDPICDDTPLKQPSRGASPEEERMASQSPVARTLEVAKQDELPAAPPVSSQRSGTALDEDMVQDLVLESLPETSPLRDSEGTSGRKASTSALSTPRQNHTSIVPSYSAENIHATVSIKNDGQKETRDVHGLPTPDSEGMRQSPTAQADTEGLLSLEVNATPQPGPSHGDRDALDPENLMRVKQELDNSAITHTTAASAQEPATSLRTQMVQSPARTAGQTFIYISDDLETPKKVPPERVPPKGVPFKKFPTKNMVTQRVIRKRRSPSVILISDDDLEAVGQTDESIITISDDDDEKSISLKTHTSVGSVDENAPVPLSKIASGSAAGSNHDVEVDSTIIMSFGNPAGTSTPLRGEPPVDSGSAVDGQLAGNELSTSAVAENEGANNLLTRALSPVSDLSRSPSPAPVVPVQTPPQRARASALPEPSSAVKKYIATLDAEDEVPIIPPKKRKAPEATASTIANNVAGPSNHLKNPDAPRKSLLVLQKKGKSSAVTKVKKRKAPADGVDENDDQPPLKKANMRKDSFKGIEQKTKPQAEHKAEKETIKVKDKGKLRDLERPDRTPTVQTKIEQVHTPLRGQPSRSVNVKWPPIDNPNFDQFIQCNTCKDWYHIGCVGVAPNDPRLDDSEDYSCPPCDAGVTSQASESPIKNDQSNYPKVSACSRPKCHRRQKTKKKKSEPEPQTYVVEAFIGRYRKVIGGKGITTFYLVKWHGYPLGECTWEELNGMGLANSAGLIDAFEKAATEEDIDLKAFEDECQLLQEAIDAGWSTSPPV